MQYRTFFAQDATGRLLTNAAATVTVSDGGATADIFDETGASLSNPLSVGASGQVAFAAANGEYDISVSQDGAEVTIERVLFDDAPSAETEEPASDSKFMMEIGGALRRSTVGNAATILNGSKTAATWTSDNDVLALGQIGVETDTGPRFKIGDGVSAWNDLPYAEDTHAGDQGRVFTATAYGMGQGGDDVAALNALIAKVNAAGGAASARLPITVNVPPGLYDLTAGGVDAITVSNVHINADAGAIFLLKDGPAWTFGDGSTNVENIFVTGGQPSTRSSDTSFTDCAWVYGVNCARVFIEGFRANRLPHIFKAVSTTTLSTIFIRHFYGTGLKDYNWIDIDTTGASAAAGLYVVEGNGYPADGVDLPAALPIAISGATNADPVEITCTGHGLETGDYVTFRGVAGMTDINGNEYQVTVSDANTYTLDGIDGTGFGTYTSGGAQVPLHKSGVADKAVVRINGKWDTARIVGGVYQHYAWLWKLTATDSMSFIFDENVTFDYGGSGRFDIEYNGGTFSHVRVNGGWTFAFNEDWLKTTSTSSGSLRQVEMRGHKIGLCGGSIINEASGRIERWTADNIEIDALNRTGSAYGFRFAAAQNMPKLTGVVFQDPTDLYGGTANSYLRANTGFATGASVTEMTLALCQSNAVTTDYSIGTPTSGGGKRTIVGNKILDGSLPEYVTTSSVTMPASGATTTNHTGLTQTINLRGGTMTNVSKNGTVILSGLAAYSFDVAPGETWSCTYSSTPTLVISSR